MDNALKLRVMFDMIDNWTKPLRGVLNSNKGLAQSLKKTRGELVELGRQQKAVATFREMHGGLAKTTSKLADAQATVKALASSLRTLGPPSRQMTAQFARARDAASRLRAEQKRQTAALDDMRKQLAGAGINTANLAQHERTLRSRVAATTAAMQAQTRQLEALGERERRLARARTAMQATRGAANGMAGAGATMIASGTAIGATTIVPLAAYARAEDSATGLSAALMRAGSVVPAEFAKINALAVSLGNRLPGTTSDFQEMMTMLVRQGISVEAVLGGMGEAAAYLAVQLKKAPAEAAEFSAKLQDATRTRETDMLQLMDVIQKSFYLGVDDNNMLAAFSKLAPAMDTARLKGLDGAKALAPIVVMADQSGLEGGAAGNALRKVFQLGMDKQKVMKANKTLEPNRQLDFTDGRGEFGGLKKMFGELDKLKTLNTQRRGSVLKTVFGDDAETLQMVSLLIEKGEAGYEEVFAKMERQATLKERVNRQLGTLKNLWDASSGTLINAFAAIGESIAPELKAITEWIGQMAERMGTWAKEHPRLSGAILKTTAVLALLLVGLGGISVALASVLVPLAMLRFSMSVLGMKGGLLRNVFGRFAPLLRGPVAQTLSITSGKLRLLSRAGSSLGTAYRMLATLLRSSFARATSAAGRALGVLARGLLLVGRVALANPIVAVVSLLAAAAIYVWQNWETLGPRFAALGETIREALGTVGKWIQEKWRTTIEWIRSAFAAVGDSFGSIGTRFAEIGSDLISGLVTGITNSLGRVKQAIGNVADSTVAWFKDKLRIQSPSRVFAELGGFIGEGAARGMTGKQRNVSRAALGLAVAATTAFGMPTLRAAERTVRAIVPIDRRPPIAAPAPPVSLQQPTAAATATPIVINIYPRAGDDPSAIARAVAAELDRRERAQRSRTSARLSD
jgi:TP901 family phage tail tape measure protein